MKSNSIFNKASIEKNIKKHFEHFDYAHIYWLFCENSFTDWINNKEHVDQNTKKPFMSPAEFFKDGDHYFEQQIDAFLWGLNTLPLQKNGLTWTWIEHLHTRCTNGLHNEGSDKITGDVRYSTIGLDFLNPMACFLLNKETKASVDGIKELFQEFNSIKQDILFYATDKNNQTYLIPYHEVEFMLKMQIECFEKNKEDILKYKKYINSADNFINIDKLNEKNKLILEYFSKNYPVLHSDVGYVLPEKNPMIIRKIAEQFIENYNKKMKKFAKSPPKNQDKIIIAILTLVKGLLNLHVWHDGNGRLCAHQLLNLLLLQNGFSPTILKNNCLDAYSLQELCDRVKEGFVIFNNIEKLYKDMQFMGEKQNEIEKLFDNVVNKEKSIFEKKAVSSFCKAVLQQKFNKARQIVGDMTHFSSEELHVFSGCSKTQLSWLKSHTQYFVDDKEISFVDLFKKILRSACDQANHTLIIDMINHAKKNKDLEFVILNKTINLIIISDNKIFKLLKGQLKDVMNFKGGELKLLEAFPYITNEDNSKTILKLLKNNIIDNIKLFDKNSKSFFRVLQQIFKRQHKSIIKGIIELWNKNNPMQDKKMSHYFNKLISNRDDLTNEEKIELTKMLDKNSIFTLSLDHLEMSSNKLQLN